MPRPCPSDSRHTSSPTPHTTWRTSECSGSPAPAVCPGCPDSPMRSLTSRICIEACQHCQLLIVRLWHHTVAFIVSSFTPSEPDDTVGVTAGVGVGAGAGARVDAFAGVEATDAGAATGVGADLVVAVAIDVPRASSMALRAFAGYTTLRSFSILPAAKSNLDRYPHPPVAVRLFVPFRKALSRQTRRLLQRRLALPMQTIAFTNNFVASGPNSSWLPFLRVCRCSPAPPQQPPPPP